MLLFLSGVGPLAASTLWAKPQSSRVPARFTKYPFDVQSLTIGYPNDGRQVRAKRLRDTVHLLVRKKSRRLNYGHPALVLMLRRSAREIAGVAKGSVMLVGDLSRKSGGALAGHFSHQTGRDADVGFYLLNRRGKPINGRRFVAFDQDGEAKDGSGLRFDDHRNWLLVQSWVRDKRAGLSHIFVSRELRRRLLNYARKQRRFRRFIPAAVKLLKQPEYASPHDDHFHVRIACPKAQLGLCKNESRKKP